MPGKDDVQMNSSEQEFPVDRGPVEADYQARLAALNQCLSRAQLRQSRALAFLGGCALLMILSMVWDGHPHFSFFATIPALGIVIFLCDYLKQRKSASRIAHRCVFYERGIDRVHLKWDTLARTGKEFARDAIFINSIFKSSASALSFRFFVLPGPRQGPHGLRNICSNRPTLTR